MIAIFPEIMSATEHGDLEKLAILVRKYFAGKDRFKPAPHMHALVESAGIVIQRVPLEIPGILAARDEKGTLTVAAFVNEKTSIEDERFMLAHMLGHFFIEMMPQVARGEWSSSGFRETTSPLKRFVQNITYDQNRSVELARELLADRFAGALLMPVAMVIKAAEKISDHNKLAAFFQVSKACLQRRLVDCGLIGSMPVSFMDAEQRLLSEQKITHAPEEMPVIEPVEVPVSKTKASASYLSGKKKDTQPSSVAMNRSREAPKGESIAQLVETARKEAATSTQGPMAQGGDEHARVTSLKGMDRIREIARRLDKGGSKEK